MKFSKKAAIWLVTSPILLISVLALSLSWSFLRDVKNRPVTDIFSGDSVNFAAFGDQGMGNYRQWQVSRALNQVAEERGIDFVTLLGDSFYRYGIRDTDDLQWRYKFERMYSGAGLANVPFYAVLGNHDYYGNEAAMREYSDKRLGSGRWRLPDKDYVKYFGQADEQALLKVVFLETSSGVRDIRYTALELEALLDAARPSVWTIVATHEPLRSAGLFYASGAMDAYRSELLPVLQRFNVDAYLSGHHHNLQMLSYPDEPLYVISGAAGKYGDELASDHGETLLFGGQMQGFAYVSVSFDALVVELIDEAGSVVFRHEI